MSAIIFSRLSIRRLDLRSKAAERCNEAILSLFSRNRRSMAAMSLLISSTGRRPPSASPATVMRFSRDLISARFSEMALMSANTALMSESLALTTIASESRWLSASTTTCRPTHDARAAAAPSAAANTICFMQFFIITVRLKSCLPAPQI